MPSRDRGARDAAGCVWLGWLLFVGSSVVLWEGVLLWEVCWHGARAVGRG